jgi:hypothetical protein
MKSLTYVGALLAALLFAAAFAYGTQPKPNYRVTRLSANAVGVSCLNGGDPTGRKVGDVLILTCGE